MNFKRSITSNKSDIVENLRQLLKIRSVRDEPTADCPYGGELFKSLEFCLNLADSLGLRTGSMDGQLGWCECGEGEELICVLTHLDIVPEGDGWAYPPFGGVIAEGKIFGRGTLDNKGPAIAAIYALKALSDSGARLSRRVRVIFGLNEENGCADVQYYVNNGGEIPVMAFTPDGAFPIINGEKGMILAEFSRNVATSSRGIQYLIAGSFPNVVPNSAVTDIKLPAAEAHSRLEKPLAHCRQKLTDVGVTWEMSGKGAHASAPQDGVNAIVELFRAIKTLDFEGDSGALTSFILENFDGDVNGKALGIYCRDEVSGELTVNLGLMHLSNNVASLSLDIRYPISADSDTLLKSLREKMASGGFSEINLLHRKAIYSPPESELVKALSRVYEKVCGEKAELLTIGGGTYSKFIPNCVAFGPIFPGEAMLDHQPNEFISIESLMKNTELYAAAMYELAK